MQTKLCPTCNGSGLKEDGEICLLCGACGHIPEWTSLEDIIAKHEADQVMREHLKNARKRLAPYLYKPTDPRYERMMRGEGPKGGSDETR